MRRTCHVVSFAIAFATLTAASAAAAEPLGEWLVKDGSARIRIEACANGLWGFVSWTKRDGVDGRNPDPAKRARPILGIPIIRGMTPAGPDKWAGEIYNAESGKMYDASIALLQDDVLRVEGCVLGGIFCGGENWTRVPPQEATPQPSSEPAAKPSAKQKPAKPRSGVSAAPPASRVCSDD
jgi:uncharacterized protein (DUF2147 family)